MKTLVTGASGMLGSAVLRELRSRGEKEFVGWSRSVGKSPHRDVLQKVDLIDSDVVEKLLRAYRPGAIIHCAALTDADFCEKNSGITQAVNACVPGELAKIARSLEARFIHVSTDAVYDDSGQGKRNEGSRLNPLSVYATTKLEGEGRVLAVYPEALVVRTTMFGWTLKTAPRPKFAEAILAALTNREQISLFRDAIFSPLHVSTLGKILLDLAELDFSGVLNVGAPSPISKADFGREIAWTFGLEESLIVETSVDDLELPAKRTKNVGLDISVLSRIMGVPQSVSTGIGQLYREAFDGTAKKIRGRETYP